jgi:hypothetical protein
VLIVLFSPRSFLGQVSSTLWLVKLLPNELGLRLLSSTTTAREGKEERFPRFKKHQTHGSVEYKTCGWKLSEDRRTITFTDGFKAGSFKLWGTRDLHFYQLNQIKRVRVSVGLTRTTLSFALMLSELRNESQRVKQSGWM